MSRGLSSTMQAAVAASTVRVALLCSFDFSGGTLYVWSGIGKLSWNGQTWSGLGELIGINPVRETNDGKSNGISFSLSGVPLNLITAATSQTYRGRTAIIYLALFDANWSIIPSPVQVWGGKMDVLTIQETGDLSTISLTGENRLVQLQVARQVRYTDGDQQRLFPGDKGMEFVSALQLKDLPWGLANPSSVHTSSANVAAAKSIQRI